MAELLIERLTGWMSRSPERVALIEASRQMTYSMLRQHALELAEEIRSHGIGKGQLVVVVGPRSLEIVVGMVAMIFSGAAYTIVELVSVEGDACPRLEQIDADLVLAVGGYEIAGSDSITYTFDGRSSLSTSLPRAVSAVGYANNFVLYTSGSTGTPKGVSVSAHNIAHYCQGVAQALGIPDGLHYAHVSTLAADPGNTGLSLAFWTGGSLYIADECERKDPRARDNLLCAYEGSSKSRRWLRSELARHVPAYMLPFRFENLVQLPMNANGKLDREAVERFLPQCFAATMASESHEEEQACEPYSKVLSAFRCHCRATNVETDSDCFDLGGDSLDAVRLISELQLEGFDVTVRAFL